MNKYINKIHEFPQTFTGTTCQFSILMIFFVKNNMTVMKEANGMQQFLILGKYNTLVYTVRTINMVLSAKEDLKVNLRYMFEKC